MGFRAKGQLLWATLGGLGHPLPLGLAEVSSEERK